MAYDFPSSPAVGTSFQPPGGPVYRWDGVTWNVQPGSMNSFAFASDTPPSNPSSGQLWFNSATGILYFWYVDPNSSQWVAISGGAPASVKTARTRNRINNPTGQVSQENGSTAVTANASYPADQWCLIFNGIVSAGARFNLSLLSPEGTPTAVGIYATTAKGSLAATDTLRTTLALEGLDVADLAWGTAAAKPVVLRFNALCDTAGTYGFAFANSASDRAYCGSFTITTAGVWQSFSFAIPGDTTGTWLKDTGVGMYVVFSYAAGSNFVGVAGWQAGNKFVPAGCSNGAAVANKVLYITDVGLYADPDNTGVAPPFIAPPYEDDLARCMRYWNYFGGCMVYGYNAAGQPFIADMSFPPMRATPTVAYSGATYSNASGVANNGLLPNHIRTSIILTAAGQGWGSFNTVLNARLI